MNNTLLEMLKDSLSYWRELFLIFIGLNALKFLVRTYCDFSLKKLEHKNRYKIEVDGDRKCIEIVSSEKIHLEKIQTSINEAKPMLNPPKSEKDAA